MTVNVVKSKREVRERERERERDRGLRRKDEKIV